MKLAKIIDGEIVNIEKWNEIPPPRDGVTYLPVEEAAHLPRLGMDVGSQRASRIAAAKQREAAILSAGLEYPPGSGVVHGLTPGDRGKYNDIKIRKDKLPNSSILVEGLGHKTVRVTPAQIEAFDDLATAHVLAVNQACLAEIDALWRATTQAEIDAIPMSNP